MTEQTKKLIQRIIQVIFLALFIILMVTGKVQLWMGLFLLGIAASFLLGRVYCGWLCSINTALIGIKWLKGKLHIKSMKTPAFLTKPWVRYVLLGIFVFTFVFVMMTGKKLPVLPALFIIGVILTFLFPEDLWHRHLCPYGTILQYPARVPALQMKIDSDKCKNCGLCVRACPAKSIEKTERQHKIRKSDCMVCLECARKCKHEAICYQ